MPLYWGLVGVSAVAYSGSTNFVPELNSWLQLVEMSASVSSLDVAFARRRALVSLYAALTAVPVQADDDDDPRLCGMLHHGEGVQGALCELGARRAGNAGSSATRGAQSRGGEGEGAGGRGGDGGGGERRRKEVAIDGLHRCREGVSSVELGVGRCGRERDVCRARPRARSSCQYMFCAIICIIHRLALLPAANSLWGGFTGVVQKGRTRPMNFDLGHANGVVRTMKSVTWFQGRPAPGPDIQVPSFGLRSTVDRPWCDVGFRKPRQEHPQLLLPFSLVLCPLPLPRRAQRSEGAHAAPHISGCRILLSCKNPSLTVHTINSPPPVNMRFVSIALIVGAVAAATPLVDREAPPEGEGGKVGLYEIHGEASASSRCEGGLAHDSPAEGVVVLRAESARAGTRQSCGDVSRASSSRRGVSGR